MDIDKSVWDIIDCYFQQQSLVRHHIESYNQFFKEDIFKILREKNPVTIVSKYNTKSKCTIFVGGKTGQLVYFEKPDLYPNEARVSNKTYEVQVFCDVEVELTNLLEKNDVPIDYERPLPEDEEDDMVDKFKNPKMDKAFLENVRQFHGGKEHIEADGSSIEEPHGRKLTVNEKRDMNVRFNDSLQTGDQIYKFVLKRMLLGKFPIMVQSEFCALAGMPSEMRFNMGECKNDLGGYFIIGGKEKAVPIKRMRCKNALYMRDNNTCIEINSVSENCSKPASTISLQRCDTTKTISVTMPNVSKPIPLFIVFRALGCISDKEIIQSCLFDLVKHDDILDEFMASVYEGAKIMSQSDAVSYIAELTQEKSVPYALMLLSDYLFPHIGETNYYQKSLFLGHMTKCLLYGVKLDEEPRVCLIGDCVSNLFSKYIDEQWTYLYKTLHTILYNEQTMYEDRLDLLIQHNYKEVVSKFRGIDVDFQELLTDSLDRSSFVSTLAQLRKIDADCFAYGLVDFVDGEQLSMSTHIVASHISREPMIQWLKEQKQVNLLDNCTFQMLAFLTKIFVNGYWVGGTENPLGFVNKFKFHRRNGLIPPFASVYFNIPQNTIYIYTDAGRLCRPLFYCDESMSYIHVEDELAKNKYNWHDLITGFNKRKTEAYGFHVLGDLYEVSVEQSADPTKFKRFREKKALLEYVDINEERSAVIATEPMAKLSSKYTHCEIHQSLLLGILSNLTAYPHHNHPEQILSSGLFIKRAASLYHTNYTMRLDASATALNNCQKPLVKSRYNDYLGVDENVFGENVIVAVASYVGEYSVIINKGSVERGLFRTTKFETFEQQEQGEVCKLASSVDTSKLDRFGVIREGSEIQSEQPVVLVGMTKKNCSLVSTGKDGIIQKTFVTEGKEGTRTAKVCVRGEAMPTVGDVISARGGVDNGIGLIVSEANMPFTKDGLRPDIIVNPHSVFSTANQLIEMIVGKSCLQFGFHGDCTAFNTNGNQIGEFAKLLGECGMHTSGNHILYDGMTGEQIESEIFVGPTYYMYTKHRPVEFQGATAKDAITRQPAASAVEYGDCEVNSLIAHGAASVLKELWDDNYYLAICNVTGGVAIYNPDKNVFLSPLADGPVQFVDSLDGKHKNIEQISRFGRKFSVVRVPYAFKTFMQELLAMGVKMSVITDDNVDQIENMKFSKTKMLDEIESKIELPEISEEEEDDDLEDLEDLDLDEDEDFDDKPTKLKIQEDTNIKYDTMPTEYSAANNGSVSNAFDLVAQSDEERQAIESANAPHTVSTMELKTYNVGDKVHFRGDFNPSRVWTIQEFDKGFAILKTEDLNGLDNELKVAHLNDLEAVTLNTEQIGGDANAIATPYLQTAPQQPVFNIVTGDNNTIEATKPSVEASTSANMSAANDAMDGGNAGNSSENIFSKPLIKKKSTDAGEEKNSAILTGGSGPIIIKKLS
jgi:DNA-directed RNA polymerase II subunit RPB2